MLYYKDNALPQMRKSSVGKTTKSVFVDQINYFVASTGFTRRIASRKSLFSKITKQIGKIDREEDLRIIYIEDDDTIREISKDKKEIKYVRDNLKKLKLNEYGVIVFSAPSLLIAMKEMQVLIDNPYCGFLDFESLMGMKVINGDILYMEFDTESG